MHRSISAFLFLLLISCGFTACKNRHNGTRATKLEDLKEWIVSTYNIDGERLREEIRHTAEVTRTPMYADKFTRSYYKNESSPLIWITRMGVSPNADTLLNCIRQAEDIGLHPEALHTDTLGQMLRRMHEYDFSHEDASSMMGRMEFLLTQSLLRYVCGQRYGFTNPHQWLNHLLIDEPPAGEVRREVQYRQLYDQGSETATDSFMHHALEETRHGRIGQLLRSVQPTDTLYNLLHNAYRQARDNGDTVRARLARINMERARWRYPRPINKKRYVWVNLATQELTAVNGDSMLTMRVCCGNQSHKTPLLHSEIRWVELNPYWVIPQTIVRKEIIPRHVGDSAYFARNSYRAINKETKEEIDPTLLSAAELRSARYIIRQENGEANSLGRIIFRFPNNFSVFLHDTNNHSAFQRQNRAISHGCIRVERPLDMALFFLNQPTELFVDRIRIALERAPLSAAGRRYKQAYPDAKPMSNFFYDTPVPVWLDYWTLYPTPSGALQAHPDPYGYDIVIEKLLNDL